MRIIGLGILAALWLAGAAAAQSPESLLGAALHEERVTGNLQAAIDGYRKTLAANGVSRHVAAQAQYHIGLCYEKLGNQEARKAFEAVVRNYGDQKQLAEQARARLAAMGGAGGTVLTREIKVNREQSCQPWNVSLDGRLMGATEYATGNMAVIDAATGACRPLTNYGQWNQQNGFVDEGAISRDGKWLAAWHYDGGKGAGSAWWARTARASGPSTSAASFSAPNGGCPMTGRPTARRCWCSSNTRRSSARARRSSPPCPWRTVRSAS
jgi:hypothetical protein